SAGNAREWQRRTRVFESVAITQGTFLTLTGGAEPLRLGAARATTELPTVLQVQPILGRWLQASEMVEGDDRVAVLGHGLWQRVFGGQDVLGRTITLNGLPATIVGVMPAGF